MLIKINPNQQHSTSFWRRQTHQIHLRTESAYCQRTWSTIGSVPRHTPHLGCNIAPLSAAIIETCYSPQVDLKPWWGSNGPAEFRYRDSGTVGFVTAFVGARDASPDWLSW